MSDSSPSTASPTSFVPIFFNSAESSLESNTEQPQQQEKPAPTLPASAAFPISLHGLADEVIMYIFSFLPGEQIVNNLSLVSKSWNALCNSYGLWKEVVFAQDNIPRNFLSSVAVSHYLSYTPEKHKDPLQVVNAIKSIYMRWRKESLEVLLYELEKYKTLVSKKATKLNFLEHLAAAGWNLARDVKARSTATTTTTAAAPKQPKKKNGTYVIHTIRKNYSMKKWRICWRVKVLASDTVQVCKQEKADNLLIASHQYSHGYLFMLLNLNKQSKEQIERLNKKNILASSQCMLADKCGVLNQYVVNQQYSKARLAPPSTSKVSFSQEELNMPLGDFFEIEGEAQFIEENIGKASAAQTHPLIKVKVEKITPVEEVESKMKFDLTNSKTSQVPVYLLKEWDAQVPVYSPLSQKHFSNIQKVKGTIIRGEAVVSYKGNNTTVKPILPRHLSESWWSILRNNKLGSWSERVSMLVKRIADQRYYSVNLIYPRYPNRCGIYVPPAYAPANQTPAQAERQMRDAREFDDLIEADDVVEYEGRISDIYLIAYKLKLKRPSPKSFLRLSMASVLLAGTSALMAYTIFINKKQILKTPKLPPLYEYIETLKTHFPYRFLPSKILETCEGLLMPFYIISHRSEAVRLYVQKGVRRLAMLVLAGISASFGVASIYSAVQAIKRAGSYLDKLISLSIRTQDEQRAALEQQQPPSSPQLGGA